MPFSVFVLVLCTYPVSVAGAQQSAGPPHHGKQRLLRYQILSGMPNTPGATGNLGFTVCHRRWLL